MLTVPGEMNYEAVFLQRSDIPQAVLESAGVQSAVLFSNSPPSLSPYVLLIEFKRKKTTVQVKKLLMKAVELYAQARHSCYRSYNYWGSIPNTRQVYGKLRQRKQMYLAGKSRDNTTEVRRTREIEDCEVCGDQGMMCPTCLSR